MLAQVYTATNIGFEGQLVQVECDVSNGLPGFVIVGLADKAVDESKERIKSALRHSELHLPPKRITINLAPADLPKDGTGYDVSMALAILLATEQLEASCLQSGLFIGELALDGSIRPVRGALNAAEIACSNGLTTLFVPADNAAEASLITDITIYPVASLAELYRHLVGENLLKPYTSGEISSVVVKNTTNLSEIYDQTLAKRALEIAAAGNHNLLLSGPPGCGKSLLAKALPSLLPPPEEAEVLEITKIYSLAGLPSPALLGQRPFRSPHHTSSSVALTGGGRWPKPGEISLSHHGVLFLDELPEFPRAVLEVLRQPLEDGYVSVARATGSAMFPSNFLLVATQNPCPCGYAGDDDGRCTCAPSIIHRYTKKISGPLLDRIDLLVNVHPVQHSTLLHKTPSEPSASVARRVLAARQFQQQRFADTLSTNATMTNKQVQQHCQLAPAAQALAEQALKGLGLSARAYFRVLKVARTIADLATAEAISEAHLAEALQFRIQA